MSSEGESTRIDTRRSRILCDVMLVIAGTYESESDLVNLSAMVY